MMKLNLQNLMLVIGGVWLRKTSIKIRSPRKFAFIHWLKLKQT
jgi:hypothetical protein